MKIASSGQLAVVILGAFTVVSFLLSGQVIGAIGLVAFIITIVIFRVTAKPLACGSTDMVVPISGQIIDFTTHYIDQRYHRKWQRLDIQRFLFGPWMFYSPLEGRVMDAWVQDNHELDCMELVFQIRSSVQDEFLLILVANFSLNYFDKQLLQPGTILGKGSDLGFCTIRRMAICTPANWVLTTQVGDKLQARSDVLFRVGLRR